MDLRVAAGGIHAVIGPNGAGKTTLFNLVSGLLPPSAGRIVLAGQDVTRLPAHRRAALGVARTFQNIRIFGAMTVLENVLTGLHTTPRATLPEVIARLPRFRRQERAAVARARGGAGPGRPARPGRQPRPPPCPTATRGGWRSPARWRPAPACCCWTSRPPG